MIFAKAFARFDRIDAQEWRKPCPGRIEPRTFVAAEDTDVRSAHGLRENESKPRRTEHQRSRSRQRGDGLEIEFTFMTFDVGFYFRPDNPFLARSGIGNADNEK